MDIRLYLSCKFNDVQREVELINSDLHKLYSWSTEHGLKLNPTKSTAILYLSCKFNDVQREVELINSDLHKLYSWSTEHGLKLNPTKSTAIVETCSTYGLKIESSAIVSQLLILYYMEENSSEHVGCDYQDLQVLVFAEEHHGNERQCQGNERQCQVDENLRDGVEINLQENADGVKKMGICDRENCYCRAVT
ncbi:hypothetical protein B566_EDAN013541 [Ephemera danica]|nr:hypothetical protein B566_EDAN013541 [Ephemera danica]